MNFNNQYILCGHQDVFEISVPNAGVLVARNFCLQINSAEAIPAIIEGVKLVITDTSEPLDVELQADQIIVIYNAGANAVSLAHNVGSTIESFQFPNDLDYTLQPKYAMSFICINTAARKGWVPLNF